MKLILSQDLWKLSALKSLNGLKQGASSRWLLGPNSAWPRGSIQTVTIEKTHLSLRSERGTMTGQNIGSFITLDHFHCLIRCFSLCQSIQVMNISMSSLSSAMSYINVWVNAVNSSIRRALSYIILMPKRWTNSFRAKCPS